MVFTETVTIINNSGKVISTGRHLSNLWKEAKAAYRDKKDAQKAEKAAISGMKRAQTFNVTPAPGPRGPHPDYDDFVYDREFRAYRENDYNRRRSIEDSRSRVSGTTHRSDRSRRSDRRSASHSRPPLTASNLRTFSETSSMPPSAAPQNYRSPYVETLPRDTQLSRPTLIQSQQTLPYPPSTVYSSPPAPGQLAQHYPPSVTETMTPATTARNSMLVHRPASESNLAALGKGQQKEEKKIDMNLAYGECPPDLASRVDLDPNYQNSPEMQEEHARQLMERIDSMLDEAECVHHSATSIINHLQQNPEQAAAVALTLAELSALLAKMSPAFLSVVKGGAPVVWGLLASPQFLIAAGVAVGVTIVTFGGWKIIKRIKEVKEGREKEAAFTAEAPPPMPPRPTQGQAGFAYGATFGAPEGSEMMDEEALVLAETQSELSSIESWRRGIVPFGEDARADVELMSKETARIIKAQYRREREDNGQSVASAARSSRSRRAPTAVPSERGSARSGSGSGRGEVLIENANGDSLVDSVDDEEGLPDDDESLGPGDSISHVGTRVTERTERSHRSSKSHRSHKSSRSYHSSRSERDDITVPSRGSSKAFREADKESEVSDRSRRSKASSRRPPSTMKMIEDGSRAPDMTLESVLSGGSSKSKKGDKENLLRKLFRKKEKDEKERERSVVSRSVMV